MKTMVVRGHEFRNYHLGEWDSATTEVELGERSGYWVARIPDADYLEANGPTADAAFSALQSKVREFCEGVMKNFEEVKP